MPKPLTPYTLIAFVCLAASACLLSVFAPIAQADEPAVDYVRDVKSVLAKNCYKCHGPDEQKSDLRLDTVAATIEGGYSGAAITPG